MAVIRMQIELITGLSYATTTTTTTTTTTSTSTTTTTTTTTTTALSTTTTTPTATILRHIILQSSYMITMLDLSLYNKDLVLV